RRCHPIPLRERADSSPVLALGTEGLQFLNTLVAGVDLNVDPRLYGPPHRIESLASHPCATCRHRISRAAHGGEHRSILRIDAVAGIVGKPCQKWMRID